MNGKPASSQSPFNDLLTFDIRSFVLSSSRLIIISEMYTLFSSVFSVFAKLNIFLAISSSFFSSRKSFAPVCKTKTLGFFLIEGTISRRSGEASHEHSFIIFHSLFHSPTLNILNHGVAQNNNLVGCIFVDLVASTGYIFF